MEYDQIIEDIDSLWFFSNILSPPKSPMSVSVSTDENIIITTQNPPPAVSDSESDKVQCESYTDSQFDISASETEYSETESEVQEELGSFGLKTTTTVAEEEDIMEKKEETGRRYTRGNEGFDFRDLGFDFRDIAFDSIIIPMMPKLPKSGNPYLICKMPPLSDGMAMKKHLKLWAHAVACTVK